MAAQEQKRPYGAARAALYAAKIPTQAPFREPRQRIAKTSTVVSPLLLQERRVAGRIMGALRLPRRRFVDVRTQDQQHRRVHEWGLETLSSPASLLALGCHCGVVSQQVRGAWRGRPRPQTRGASVHEICTGFDRPPEATCQEQEVQDFIRKRCVLLHRRDQEKRNPLLGKSNVFMLISHV